jgi:hypothetical protein
MGVSSHNVWHPGGTRKDAVKAGFAEGPRVRTSLWTSTLLAVRVCLRQFFQTLRMHPVQSNGLSLPGSLSTLRPTSALIGRSITAPVAYETRSADLVLHAGRGLRPGSVLWSGCRFHDLPFAALSQLRCGPQRPIQRLHSDRFSRAAEAHPIGVNSVWLGWVVAARPRTTG